MSWAQGILAGADERIVTLVMLALLALLAAVIIAAILLIHLFSDWLGKRLSRAFPMEPVVYTFGYVSFGDVAFSLLYWGIIAAVVIGGIYFLMVLPTLSVPTLLTIIIVNQFMARGAR